MDRINSSGTIDIGGGRRGFTDENLVAGTQGTELDALFLNMVQEEVVKVIEDAGIVLNPADWTQLSQALAIRAARRTAWVPVISMTTTAPPGAPAVGDTYLIPPAATGAWAGRAYDVAEWTGASWVITTTPDGHGISLPDGRVFQQIAGPYVEKLALDVQSGKWTYAVAGGSANALTATLVPAPGPLADGMELNLLIATSNTGAATLNGAAILRSDGTSLDAGDLKAGKISSLIYLAGSWYLPTLPIKASSSFRAQQSTQVVPTSTDTIITTWPSVVTNFVDSTFVAGVFTVGTKDAGLWFLAANVNYAIQNGMSVNIRKNAVTVCGSSMVGSATSIVAATMIQLVAGDTVHVLTSHLFGSTITLTGTQGVSFSGFRVSI